MNWNALKSNKCPKCGQGPLISSGKFYRCPNQSKGVCFLIGTQKFNSMVNKMYEGKSFKSDDDRLGELNNLGRKEVTEDFSDSDALDY